MNSRHHDTTGTAEKATPALVEIAPPHDWRTYPPGSMYRTSSGHVYIREHDGWDLLRIERPA